MAEPSRLSNAAIEEYAQRVGDAHDVYTDGRADVLSLVADLGGAVETRDGGESLKVHKTGRFTIFLPRFTSEMRDRFTIAHELGHYFLHYRYANVDGPMSYARGGRNRAETEANVFAATLLMPAEQFAKKWVEMGEDAWRVAGHFGVSPAAARVRAEVLQPA
jgi:predicted transcriptional regulator